MNRHDRFWRRVSLITLLCLFALAVLSLTSCRTHREYIPVQTTVTSASTDSLEHYMKQLLLMQRNVRERESVRTSSRTQETIVLNERGDTARHDTRTIVETDRTRELEIENNVLRAEIDSLRSLKARVDSVDRPVPYPVEVVREVTKPPSWWQKVLMWAGGLSLFGCAIVVLMAVRKRK